MQTLIRTIEAATEVDKRRGLVRAVISDDSTDRYDTVFDPLGCDWEGFMRSGGPILFEHGEDRKRGQVPIGNAVSIRHAELDGRRAIIAETKFWDTDEFSQIIGQAYRDMHMRGWSIRAVAHEESPPTAAERRARADWAKAETVYRSWELLEVSTTSTPGNANALTQEVLRSFQAKKSPPPIDPERVRRVISESKLGLMRDMVTGLNELANHRKQAEHEAERLEQSLKPGKPIFFRRRGREFDLYDSLNQHVGTVQTESQAARACGM
jgi:hypothetical protein